MKWLSFAIMVIMVALNFQNCSPSHSDSSGGSLNLSSLYPYSAKPEYFESIQLTGMEEISGVWKYQFVAAVVYIDDPAADVDFEIQIKDQDGNILCPRKDFTVNHSSNHVVIDDCQSGQKAELAKITLTAKLHSDTGALQPLKTYTFDLQ